MKKLGAILFLFLFSISLASAYYKYDNFHENKIVSQETIKRHYSDGYYEKIIINHYSDSPKYYSDYSYYPEYKYDKYDEWDNDYRYDKYGYKEYKPYHGISGEYKKFNQLTREYELTTCYHSPPRNKVFYTKCPD